MTFQVNRPVAGSNVEFSRLVQGRAQGAHLERGDGLVAEHVSVDGVVRAGNQEIDGAGDAIAPARLPTLIC